MLLCYSLNNLVFILVMIQDTFFLHKWKARSNMCVECFLNSIYISKRTQTLKCYEEQCQQVKSQDRFKFKPTQLYESLDFFAQIVCCCVTYVSKFLYGTFFGMDVCQRSIKFLSKQSSSLELLSTRKEKLPPLLVCFSTFDWTVQSINKI